MKDENKKRNARKLKIINNYPLGENGKRICFDVRRAAFRFFKAKTDIDLFLSITELGNGWDYTTKRVRKNTSLSVEQISKAKKKLIKSGAIAIDNYSETLTINYEVVMCKSSGTVKTDKLNKPERKSDDEDEDFGDEYPDLLGGGKMH